MKKELRAAVLFCAVLLLLPLLCACSDEETPKAFAIGRAAGYAVRYDELRFVTLSEKAKLEKVYGEGIWDDPAVAEQYRAELEAAVWDAMLNHYAVLAACQKYGISLDRIDGEDIQASVDASIENAIRECGGQAGFEAYLEATNMTEGFLRFSLAVTEMEDELRYKLSGELGLIESDSDRFMAWMQDGNAVYVQHIFIENDAGERVEDNRATAERVRAQLISGEKTVEQLIGSAVNEDLSNFFPYYVVRDVYEEATENAVLALSAAGAGAVSEVVETETGFYVFVRMEEQFDADGVNLTMRAKVDQLLTSYQWARVEQIVAESRADVSIELNLFGRSIDLLQIR